MPHGAKASEFADAPENAVLPTPLILFDLDGGDLRLDVRLIELSLTLLTEGTVTDHTAGHVLGEPAHLVGHVLEADTEG